MNSTPNLQEDFSTVVDGTVSIVLERCDGGITAIPSALRAPREAVVQSGIGFAAAEWWFFLPDAEGDVSEGDRVIEASGDCWRVVRARPTRNRGRFRCDAFLERFEEVLTDLIDIDEEIDSGQWRIVRPAVAARAQFVEASSDERSEPPVAASRYRFFVERGVNLDHRHRLRLTTGELFRVDAFRPAGPMRPLAEVDATRLPPSEL